MNSVLRLFFISLAYIASGYLAMQVSGLYGNVLAIFPPAGIALGAWLIWGWRVWLAIAAGAVGVVTFVFINNNAFDTTIVTLVGVITAIGAIFQAWLGVFLVQKFVKKPDVMLDHRDIALFFLLGGPASCVVNATVGVGVLVLSGNIASDDAPLSWVTWWLADSIGVLIFAPIVLTLFASRRDVWKTRVRGFLYPMLVVILAVGIIFSQTIKWENERMNYRLAEDSMSVTHALQYRLEVYINTLIGVERLFAASKNVNRNEFRTFVSPILDKYDGIQAIEWLPRIRDADRKRFEREVANEGFPNFEISERNENKELIRAQSRAEYFPVNFVEPYVGNEKAFGFDINSNLARRAALEQSRDTARNVATSRIQLVQEKGTQAGMLMFYPVFENGIVPADVQQRRDNLVGFVLAVFRIGDVFTTILKESGHEVMSLTVSDITEINNAELLFTDALASSRVVSTVFYSTIDIAGRKWQFEFQPTTEYLKGHRTWSPWIVLAVGLLFSGMLGAFLLTVTGSKHEVEQLVEQRTQELSAILNGAGDAIMTFDESGQMELVNPGAARLFESDAKELQQKQIGDIVPLSKSDPNKTVAQSIEESLKTPREFSMVGKNGQILRIEAKLSRIELPGRRIYVVIIRDLNERQKIEQIKGEFISVVSHELRTPLTAIKGVLALLLGKVVEPGSDEMYSLLEKAHSNSDRLSTLINDILDVEKLESGKMRFDMLPNSVSDLIAKAKEHNDAYAEKFGVNIKIEFPENDRQIRVDAFRFQQIMSNLISNAVKFSKSGSEVIVSAKNTDNSVVVGVRDFGSGIPSEFISNIYRKFAQANSSSTRTRGGTGLGLAITKSLVEAMSGGIRFETETDKGTVFYCEFPSH